MVETCGTHRTDICCIETWSGNLNGKKTLRRPRHRWEDNTKMDLRKTGWKGVDLMQSQC